ncbi:MAG: energy-coupling factor transporter transmembrane component T [Acholeplasmataceae bacterium]|jgi:energy-coupling factor transporter transmembrane protein EcfT
MSNKVNLYQKPIYPLISLLSSIIIFVVGLIFAKDEKILWFFIGLSILYIIFGYWKQLLLILPITIIMILVFGGITYLISGKLPETKYAIARVLALMLSIIPNLSINPSDLIRNMKKIKISKKITLGFMIGFSFIEVFKEEVKRIKQAMKTRRTSPWNVKVFYRAFLIPLISRIDDISDTLSISIETRGFSFDKTETTSYKDINIHFKDILYFLIVVIGIILVILL